MNEYISGLVAKYRHIGILIDTNLLLLFIVGSLNPQSIPALKRTSKYTIQDFQIVSQIIDLFEVKVTTPHILTEISNLIGRKVEIREALRAYMQIGYEQFVDGSVVAANKEFLNFGLTDSAIIEISANSYVVLTDDAPLTGALREKGIDVLTLDLLTKSHL